jgi:Zn-dependent protease
MSSLETLRTFLGWCTVINMAMLILASLAIGPMRGLMIGIHGKMFGLSGDDLSRAYFQYVANYKIAVVVFNLVPYIALVLMT